MGRSRFSTFFRRRRRQGRYAFEAPLEVRCSSWSKFHQLFSRNVAKTGLFIPSDRAAEVGEEAEIHLRAPDGSVIRMAAVVRHVLPARNQRSAGLGLEVTELVDADRQRYEQLVREAARACEVRPSSDPEDRVTTAKSLAVVPDKDAKSTAKQDTKTPPPPPPVPPSRAPLVAKGPPPLVAIDFGTTRSSVAVVVDQTATVLALPEGGRDIVSVVGVLDNGSVVLGKRAQDLLATDPARVLRSPKRLLGRPYDDHEIESYLASLAMGHSQGPDGQVRLHVDGKSYTVPQLCAPLLYRLKSVAEAFLCQNITDVVFTVPVSYDDDRYHAVRKAAEIAGLKIADFVDEPSAAALAHRFDGSFRGMVAVYDFGGGTFDYSILDATTDDLQVVATAGDTWLGGDDFDDALAGAAANDFWRQHNIELRHRAVQWQRLLIAAEQAKRELSSKNETVIYVPQVALRATGAIDLEFAITRNKLAELSSDIIQRSLDTCAQAMDFSEMQTSDLNAIYLSGGTTYIPAVRAAVERHFGQPARVAVPPERSVVMGAAIYAASLRASSV